MVTIASVESFSPNAPLHSMYVCDRFPCIGSSFVAIQVSPHTIAWRTFAASEILKPKRVRAKYVASAPGIVSEGPDAVNGRALRIAATRARDHARRVL